MGSEAEEAANLDKREVSMRLTKRELRRRVTEELSSLLAGRMLVWYWWTPYCFPYLFTFFPIQDHSLLSHIPFPLLGLA